MKILIFLFVFLFFYLLFNWVPRWKYYYIYKGSGLINEGKIEEGLAAFEKGAYGAKTDNMTKIRYAFLELKFGSLKKAKKMIMWVLGEKIPQNVRYEAKSVYAIILYKEGDLAEAKETMLSVYENYKNTNMYCTLGYLFNILETPENAVKFNEEAYEYNGDHPVIIDNLGQSCYLNGDIDRAYEIYGDLIKLEPKFPEAYYNFALVLHKRGDNERAKEMLEKALTKPFHQLTTVSREEIENKLEQL